jgi:hypothetical protein
MMRWRTEFASSISVSYRRGSGGGGPETGTAAPRGVHGETPHTSRPRPNRPGRSAVDIVGHQTPSRHFCFLRMRARSRDSCASVVHQIRNARAAEITTHKRPRRTGRSSLLNVDKAARHLEPVERHQTSESPYRNLIWPIVNYAIQCYVYTGDSFVCACFKCR